MTAFVRDPARLTIAHPNLMIARGDVLNYGSVEQAVRDQDAVLSALGTRTLGKTTILSDGTQNIITAMERSDVRRFVCESSLSAIAAGS